MTYIHVLWRALFKVWCVQQNGYRTVSVMKINLFIIQPPCSLIPVEENKTKITDNIIL